MRRLLRETRYDSRSRRRHTDPARQLPADRYLAVTTLQDDRAEGDPADHFHGIIDRLDSGPAANRYAVDPHPSSPGLED
jgi:hypothetical protein